MDYLKHTKRSTALPHTLSRRKQLERDVEHITQEMYRRNRELAETNQTLSLLQTINGLALDASESITVVCEKIATAVAETAGFPFVTLITTDTGSPKDLVLQGTNLAAVPQWKTILGKRKTIHLESNAPLLHSDTTGMLLPVPAHANEKLAELLDTTPLAIQQLRAVLPIQSLYIARLKVRDKLVGYLVTGLFSYPEQVHTSDTTLLDRLIEPIGVALDSRLLLVENEHVLSQLRRSNAKLKQLDTTKDEFISMASHQLRTPLTSVKGYLSMVLEGDVGKLNKQQTELLSQSYASAQRMVYLISDLLNLSRLNTGKFIIDSTPVDLRDVIRAEIGQLSETAKSRGITLHYTDPEDFPSLMLDETKIHQVVMNFIDNAIYYTPGGGEVHIELHETPSAVEYRVVDNGIGVPRVMQKHLFTKFYRADNARQARPDGTGLGLFMAKKVIVAQGGALVFKSEEGKGSTFGFRFSKAKHLAPADRTNI